MTRLGRRRQHETGASAACCSTQSASGNFGMRGTASRTRRRRCAVRGATADNGERPRGAARPWNGLTAPRQSSWTGGQLGEALARSSALQDRGLQLHSHFRSVRIRGGDERQILRITLILADGGQRLFHRRAFLTVGRNSVAFVEHACGNRFGYTSTFSDRPVALQCGRRLRIASAVRQHRVRARSLARRFRADR